MLNGLNQDKKIDGKKISENVGNILFLELKERDLVGKVSLGILCVGNDQASLSFIAVKKKFGEKFGFVVNVENIAEPKLTEKNETENFKNKIIIKLQELQKQNDAVILQLPLPESLANFTGEILQCLKEEKDVDNLSGGNFEAPIILALQKIFNQLGRATKEKTIGVVGLGQVVGLPVFQYLTQEKYNVINITRDSFSDISKCDVVISGVGQANLIGAEHIKDGAIIIDYGCSYVYKTNKTGEFSQVICGDFDESCYQKSSFYTPVPGCMGPLVVASLFENVLKAKTNYSS